ncbi:conserved membrane hypothetical protein [metagenome]|uniref:Stage II sporulation protein M n=1 Tax=metagenome TaxID=256318 RepID=A0A2P2BYP4_9ZZZZ
MTQRLVDEARPAHRTGRFGDARPAWLAGVLAVALCAVAVVAGFQAIDPDWARASLGAGDGAGADLGTGQILARNAAVALFLYTGVATGGISTALGVVMTSMYVGATMAVGVENAGAGALFGQILTYAPFEFVGLIVAAAAGLLPVCTAIMSPPPSLEGASAFRRYIHGITASIPLLVLSLALLTVGAVIEAIQISHTSGGLL